MPATLRLELNRDGIRREVLNGEGTKALVEASAAATAEQARSVGLMVEGEPGETALPITSQASHFPSRARAIVTIDHPSGLAVEAKHRLLASSLRMPG